MMKQVSRARVFDDFGGAALGDWGRRFVYITVYATILAEPIIFHLTSMEALQQIFYDAGLTQKFTALVVTVVMVPLAQVLLPSDEAWKFLNAVSQCCSTALI